MDRSVQFNVVQKSGGKIPVILAHLANFAHTPAPLAMLFQESGGGRQLQLY
jgi:hypothetical protein